MKNKLLSISAKALKLCEKKRYVDAILLLPTRNGRQSHSRQNLRLQAGLTALQGREQQRTDAGLDKHQLQRHTHLKTDKIHDK